ncbi:uncharacterized protein LOC126789893 isoform X2 [Argentina anserina]|uniref:uncharacterized protein LOC126789893 isoform X2 n=1 Tax=Argentina anserina TaxID=57926 RepID=UPI0021765F46|nr:uncharacterized protein LOC126789893 isoform X2 [Potentilla anserina]
MAMESNTGFLHDETFGYGMNRHAMSFQSRAINSSSEMIPMGNYFSNHPAGMGIGMGVGMGMGMGMMFSPNSGSGMSMVNHSPVISQPGNSSGAPLLVDSVPGLKHDTGLAVEWSMEEQYKLEEGLVKYADEPSIMRYIKIAATLRDKTVRDVALRCRWMTRKRRKSEDYTTGKKSNIRKDKLVESSSKISIPSAPQHNMAAYSLMMHRMDQNERLQCEGISGTAKHLLDQNAQAFNQITTNLSTYKLQDNIDLFCRTRNNLSAILNDMRGVPGFMSQMPPLNVCINEDLANSVILPNTT